MPEDRRTPAEQIVREGVEEQLGRPLSRHALRYERSLDAHLRANAPPRWMERLAEIERATRFAERELGRLHAEVDDPARWVAIAETWDFEAVNELIRIHNEWYPVERDLPLNPRTGEYRWPYRRDELGPAWILSRFPPRP